MRRVNIGIANTGLGNTGNHNSGNFNSGNWNSGDYNSGDYNKINCSNGCFNTKELKISMFNKPSDWSIKDWRCSKAKKLLDDVQQIWFEKEKKQYPKYKTMGGYLKELDKSECGQLWWNALPDCDKNVIKALPNFDTEIFKEITGIDINKG